MPEDPPDPPPSPPGAPAPGATPAPGAVPPPGDGLAEPVIGRRRRWRVSLVWLLPIVALAIGASMHVRSVFLIGPRIEIEFASAEGVEAGKTDVRYKDVVIGKVRSVNLRGEDKRVVVGVQLDRSATNFAVEDTSFWVVRPRINAEGVSGLGTLLSGAYIAADAGVSKSSRTSFKGLESPPLVMRGEPGAIFALRAEDLGSLDVGSPVFHRRAHVGRVVAHTLDADRDTLLVKIFIDAPYQKLVTKDTRFWNVSGFNLRIDAGGVRLNTQTLQSILAGGIAFDTPGPAGKAPPAPAETTFSLFDDRQSAMSPPDGPPLAVKMTFDGSVRGLAEGAPIDLLGLEVGKVTDVALQYDERTRRLPIEVSAVIYPYRLGAVRNAVMRSAPAGAGEAETLRRLVAHGLRAQLRTGNLLTGQLYVALDFVGKGDARAATEGDGVLRLPTVKGTFADVQPQIAEIVEKISKIPFEEIGKDLRTTLASASSALAGANNAIGKLTPEAQKALAEIQKTLRTAEKALDNLDRTVADPNAPVQKNLEATLLELQRASRSIRVLSDYLQQHPESLLRGRPVDPPTRCLR